MTKNIGVIDRIIRAILGVILLYVSYIYGMTTIFSIVLFVVAVILIVESFIGWCLIYKILGIDTAKSKMMPSQPQQPQQPQGPSQMPPQGPQM